MTHPVANHPKLRTVGSEELEETNGSVDILRLDLGLSIWMKRNAIGPNDCRSAMLAIRAALLAVAGMDVQSEPVPLHGHSPERDVANFAAYLGGMFVRASAAAECELPRIIGRASEYLAAS
jgi:hypothetical protein